MAADDDARPAICLTGPESTGKTTLAAALADALGGRVVPEVARTYLAGRAGYAEGDLLEIARRQVDAERAARAAWDGLLVCDTDLLVVGVWWREKYGGLPRTLVEMLARRGPRGYLLLAPDVPWESDPLRESPHDRDRLFDVYRAELERSGFPYRVVTGLGPARVDRAVREARALVRELSAGPHRPSG